MSGDGRGELALDGGKAGRERAGGCDSHIVLEVVSAFGQVCEIKASVLVVVFAVEDGSGFPTCAWQLFGRKGLEVSGSLVVDDYIFEVASGRDCEVYADLFTGKKVSSFNPLAISLGEDVFVDG